MFLAIQIDPIPCSDNGDFPESRSPSTAAVWLDAQRLQNGSRPWSGEWRAHLSATNASRTGSTFLRSRKPVS